MLKLLSRPKGYQGASHTTLTLGRARVVLVVGAPPVEVELAPPFVKMLEPDRSVLMTDLPIATVVGAPPVEAVLDPPISKATVDRPTKKKNDKKERQ